MMSWLQRQKHALALVAILLAGAILRVYRLDFQSYWVDELWSVRTSAPDAPFLWMLRETILDVHPPLYQLLLWIWLKLWGFSEFSARSLSVLLGVLVIPAIYSLARRLFDRDTALIAALILSLNIFFIEYSQEARSYALLALLTLLSFVAFVDYFKKNTKGCLVVYAFFIAALLNTHYFGIVIVFAQFLFFILSPVFNKSFRIRYSHLFVVSIVAIISIMPIIQSMINNISRDNYWMPVPDLAFALYCYLVIFHNHALVIIASLLLMTSILIPIVTKRTKDYASVTLLVLWIATGIVIPVVLSLVSTPCMTSRNTTIVVPALFILMAFGVTLLPRRWLKAVTLTSIVILSLIPLFFSYNYYHVHRKIEFRQAVQKVLSNNAGLAVYALGEKCLHFNVYFELYTGKKLALCEDRLRDDLASGTLKSTGRPFVLLLVNGYPENVQAIPGLSILEQDNSLHGITIYLAVRST